MNIKILDVWTNLVTFYDFAILRTLITTNHIQVFGNVSDPFPPLYDAVGRH